MMDDLMVVILCPGYSAAEDAYYEFIGVLRCAEYWGEIAERHDPGLMVTLDNDISFIFIDEHWQKVVERDLPDTVDWDYMGSFFDDIYNDKMVPWYE